MIYFGMQNKFYVYNIDNIILNDKIDDYNDLLAKGYNNIEFVYLFDEEDLLNNNIENTINSILSIIKEKVNLDNITISFQHKAKENINNNII